MALFGLFGPPNIEKMKANGDVKGLIKALYYRKDDRVLPDAVAALISMGSASVEPLAAVLGTGGSYGSYVGARIVETLHSLKDPRALEPLAVALRNKDWEVRLRVVEAWGKIGDVRAVGLLTGALKDKVWDVRKAAVSALARIGDARAVESLIGALEDDDARVWVRVMEVLGEVGDPRAVKPLIEIMKDGSKKQECAIEALERFGAAAVESLIEALRYQGYEEMNIEAQWTQKDLHHEEMKAENVRMGVVKALQKIGDARAVEPLALALEDKSRMVRGVVQKALISFGVAAVGPVIGMLKNENPYTQDVLKSSGAAAVEPLIEALKDKDAGVRKRVVEVLHEIGDARAVEPLIEALKDKDADVRKAAVAALARIGDARAVGPLIEALLRDKDADVRKRVVEALGRIGDARAVEPLMIAVEDEDPEVGMNAVAALHKIGDPRAVKALVLALKVENSGWKRVMKALVDLEWKPENDVQHAWEAVFHHDWDRIIKLGTASIEPMIAALEGDDEDSPKIIQRLGEIGDSRALRPILSDLKNPRIIAISDASEARYNRALLRIINLSSDKIPTEDLLALVNIGAVTVGHETEMGDNAAYSLSTRSADFSQVKQRAREELQRRNQSRG